MLTTMNVNLTNAVVVIDEGHNFSQSAKEASSFKLERGQVLGA